MLILLFGGALIFLTLLTGIVSFAQQKLGLGAARLPDFGSVENIDERKEAFFKYVLPLVEASNTQLLDRRARLEAIRERLMEGERLSFSDRRWAGRLVKKYDLGELVTELDAGSLDVLLEHVDVVPAGLALAQAALESGWGMSRFAREGNNLFGMWCYRRGCGIVPRDRPKGATHEVARYRTLQRSVDAYIRNLNVNAAYAPMREVRKHHRDQGQPLTGEALAAGLLRYSEEGEAYVEKIRTVIRSNDLDRLDRFNLSS